MNDIAASQRSGLTATSNVIGLGLPVRPNTITGLTATSNVIGLGLPVRPNTIKSNSAFKLEVFKIFFIYF